MSDDIANDIGMLDELIALKGAGLQPDDYNYEEDDDEDLGYDQEELVAEAEKENWSANYYEMGLSPADLKVSKWHKIEITI